MTPALLHQHVDARMGGANGVGEAANVGEAREVERHQRRLRAADGGARICASARRGPSPGRGRRAPPARPCAASACAASKPRPLLAPVMTTVLPLRSGMSASLHPGMGGIYHRGPRRGTEARISVVLCGPVWGVVLDIFHPATRAWFASAFAAPTQAQRGAWEAIAERRHALVVAPTGSGKTLAAFLWSLDRLLTQPSAAGRGVRVLYISPLKALAVDVERNLRAPLAGIRAAAERLELTLPAVSVALRSGDTAAAERRALRARSGGHPHHHAGVAVPAARLGGARNAARRRHRHRRRDPRRRRHQARQPPGAQPRAPRPVAAAAGAAHRAVGDGAADRRGRPVPRRRPAGDRRRRARAEAVGDSRRGTGRRPDRDSRRLADSERQRRGRRRRRRRSGRTSRSASWR